SGILTIKVVDQEAMTIGEDSILAEKDVKFIQTKAVTTGSKIYVTPIGSTDNQVIYVGEIDLVGKVENDGLKGFEVRIDRLEGIEDPKEIRFNWWIVETD
ncbi:MAG TPA: hypothetical protein DIC35_01400, partial [Candidatus Moranbacteria bacterium]|nr:hypothetical protein [Candidatus Moranbacteria bacterium]